MLWMLYELPETSATTRLGQKRGDDAGGAPAPIIAAENRALDSERVHEVKKVHAEGRLLARARRLGLEEPRRPVAAQIRNDHPRPGLRKDRRGLIIGMRVVGKAVAHDARPAGRGSVFQIGDGKNAGVDRLDGCRHVSLVLRKAALGSTFMRGQRPRSQRLDAASRPSLLSSRFQFEADAWRSLLYLWRWRAGRHKVCIPFASAYPKAPLRAFFVVSILRLMRKGGELRLWPST